MSRMNNLQKALEDICLVLGLSPDDVRTNNSISVSKGVQTATVVVRYYDPDFVQKEDGIYYAKTRLEFSIGMRSMAHREPEVQIEVLEDALIFARSFLNLKNKYGDLTFYVPVSTNDERKSTRQSKRVGK